MDIQLIYSFYVCEHVKLLQFYTNTKQKKKKKCCKEILGDCVTTLPELYNYMDSSKSRYSILERGKAFCFKS